MLINSGKDASKNGMNRKMRRLSEREGRRRQKLDWDKFQDVTEKAIKKHKAMNLDSTFRPDRVFQNNKFIVQVFLRVLRPDGFFTKAMIRRSDAQPVRSFNDLFRIKNEIFGDEIEAIQFFPKKSELIDAANLYWLFIREKE